MKYLYWCFFLVLFNGCTSKISQSETVSTTHKKIKKIAFIKGLNDIPQTVSFYTKNIDKGYISSLDNYARIYFQAWNIERMDISLKNAMWAYEAFNATNSYGENLQALDNSFFIQMKENSDFSSYSSLNKRAITLVKSNIRAFPTDRPVLRDPKKAGEGFPFDYMQNSTIAANKPIFVSHYSKDKEWVFIKSSFAYGWLKTRDIVFIEKKYTDIWQNAQQIFITKDNKPFYTPWQDFLFKSTIGTMLPLIEERENEFIVLSIGNYKLKKPYYIKSKLSKKNGHKGILQFNAQNINLIMNELLHVKYGWGGLYNQRDCSSTIRDFFAPFGVWLPRNSYQQSRVGKVISLEGMSDEKKVATIKEQAVPFETLLYRKGHIVLYIGTLNGKIIIFQNVWGIKTKENGNEARHIIGKTIFSTLQVGSNLKTFNEEASMLKNLKSMNIVTF